MNIRLIGLMALFFGALSLSAVTDTWNGDAGDGEMGTAGNWAADAVPSNGDSLVFPASLPLSVNNNISSMGFNIGNLTINDAYTLTGYPFNITSGTSVFTFSSSGANIDFSSGGGIVTSSSTTLSVGSTAGGNTITSVISGPGALSLGSGSLTLSGANTYNGTTTIGNGATLIAGTNNVLSPNSQVNLSNSGVLHLNGFSCTIGDLQALSSAAQVNLGSGTLTLGNSNSPVFAGVISGIGGSLVKLGSGTLLFSNTPTQTFTGGITVNAGLLEVVVSTLDATSVTINSGGEAQFLLATLPNALVTVNTGGTFYLQGSLSTISNLAGAGNVILTGALNVGDSTSQTFSGVLSGVGGPLIKQGSGTLTLSGSNTYNFAGLSDIQVNAGTLELSGANVYQGTTTIQAGGVLLAGAVNAISPNSPVFISSGGTFNLNGFSNTILNLYGTGNVTLGSGTLTLGPNSGTQTYLGVISGTGGGLNLQGTGTFTLFATNTYTGSTAVGSGAILQLGVPGALSSSSGVNVASGGTFEVNSLSASILGLSGAGSVTLGSGNLTLMNSSLSTFSGIISGMGQVTMNGTGTEALTGTNTYQGGTTLEAGTLTVGNNSALGTGALTVTGSSTLQAGASGINIPQLIGINSGETLTIDTNGESFTSSGTISGSNGALNVIGAGTLILTGTNTYSGGTTISAGTLSIASASNIGGSTLSLAGGTLHGTGNSSLSQAVNVTGSSGLTTATSFTTTLSGTLTGSNGTTLTLGGPGTNSLSTVAVNGSDSFTVAGVIGGGQTLIKSGTGTLILTGANTYSGGTQIAAGTLSIGTSDNVGSGGATFTGSAILQFNTAGSYSTVIGISSSGITGSLDTDGNTVALTSALPTTGTIDKLGTGILTLDTTNTYSALNIIAGTLQAGVANALSPNAPVVLPNTDGVLLDLNGHPNTIPSLAGGGTTGGYVSLGSGTLTVGDSTSTTFGGTISGSGGISKVGAGMLTLTNFNNSYTGPTDVVAGTLSVNGAITSSLTTVYSGAMLQGVGRVIGNVTVQDGGTIHPGNSIGTFEIDGNLTLNSSSIVATEISPMNGSFLLVSGSAHLAGTLSVAVDAGLYAQGSQYLLLLATAGLSGTTFNATVFSQMNFPATVSYTSDSVLLTLMTASGKIPMQTMTGNTATVGNYLNELPMNLFNSVADYLAGLSASQTEVALLAISPSRDSFATYVAQNNAFSLGKMISTRMAQRQSGPFAREEELKDLTAAAGLASSFFSRQGPSTQGVIKKQSKKEITYDFWINDFGNWAQQDAQDQNPAFRFATQGSLIGVDLNPFQEGLLLGAMSGYFISSIHDYNGFGKQSIRSFVFGGYGRKGADDFFFEGYLGACYNRAKSYRNVVFSGFDETAESKFTIWQLLPHGKVGYNWKTPSVTVTPFVSVDVPVTFQESYQEHGADIFSMQIDERTTPFLQILLGLSTAETFEFSSCSLVFKQEAGYIYRAPLETGTTAAAIIGAPTSFQVVSFTTSESIGDLSCDLFVKHKTKGFFGFLSADGQIGSGYKSIDAFGGIGLEF